MYKLFKLSNLFCSAPGFMNMPPFGAFPPPPQPPQQPPSTSDQQSATTNAQGQQSPNVPPVFTFPSHVSLKRDFYEYFLVVFNNASCKIRYIMENVYEKCYFWKFVCDTLKIDILPRRDIIFMRSCCCFILK